MAVVQLASSTDVAEALGRDLTSDEEARVGAILDKASELFRRRSGQQFTPGTSLVRLKVNGGKVYLPQRPVVSVDSVTDDDGNAIEHTLFGQWLTTCLSSHRFVRVTYSHGAEEVPDLVRLCIAEIAAKVLSISPKARAGITQGTTTTGPFTDTETYATWAIGGQTMLAPDDDKFALSYRLKVPTVWVPSAPAPYSGFPDGAVI